MVGPLLGGKRKATFFRRWILYFYCAIFAALMFTVKGGSYCPLSTLPSKSMPRSNMRLVSTAPV